MSRTTSEKKEKCIKLRVSEELYDELSAKGNNLSATIREILKNGGSNFVPQNEDRLIPKDIYDDFLTMTRFMGGSVESMLRAFDDALNEGILIYRNGKYESVPQNYDISKLEEACSEKGVSIQTILDKVTKMVERSQI